MKIWITYHCDSIFQLKIKIHGCTEIPIQSQHLNFRGNGLLDIQTCHFLFHTQRIYATIIVTKGEIDLL